MCYSHFAIVFWVLILQKCTFIIFMLKISKKLRWIFSADLNHMIFKSHGNTFFEIANVFSAFQRMQKLFLVYKNVCISGFKNLETIYSLIFSVKKLVWLLIMTARRDILTRARKAAIFSSPKFTSKHEIHFSLFNAIIFWHLLWQMKSEF